MSLNFYIYSSDNYANLKNPFQVMSKNAQMVWKPEHFLNMN